MKLTDILYSISALIAVVAMNAAWATEQAATKPQESVAYESEGGEQAAAEARKPADIVDKATAMLQAQLGRSPDKRIPSALLAKAKCVALFPDVIQGGFIYGGKFGNGLVSCRHEATNDWGVPVFVAMGGASIGVQAGFKKADIILLAMTNKGLNQLLSGKPIVGGEASVAAGPVGRDATVNMDVLLRTPLVGYSRSKGLFAGLNLEGVVIRSSKATNKQVYGEYKDIKELLMQRSESPASVSKIRDALRMYATYSEELS